MTTWGNICRICSSPADYEVFAKIPNYLHATSNEFQHWQKPINVLLEETTGLKVSIEDGLPRYMCALCISYLKHAACFREQAINNALGLKAVQAIHAVPMSDSLEEQTQQHKDKESLLITAKDLNYSEDRKTDTNLLYSSENRDKVRKQLLNNTGLQPPGGSVQVGGVTDHEQMRYLNLLFDKEINVTNTPTNKLKRNAVGKQYEAATGSDPFGEDFQTASSDDEASEQKLNFFSYREKNFEEDDIMDMEELKEAITINIPESCKERKCRACFRRFMFEESYKEHMESCIEYKFLITIEEINRLLDIRRGKAISPHEFIRRMIFCLRKTCEWLKANCGEMLLPDLLQNGEGSVKKRLASEGKSSTAEASSGGNGGSGNCKTSDARQQKLSLNCENQVNSNFNKNKTKMTDFSFNSSITNNDLLENFQVFVSPKISAKSRGITPISMENNVLYEIERSQSRNKQEIVREINNTVTPVQEQERITFLQKLHNAASTTKSTMTTSAQQNRVETLPPVAAASPMISVRKDLLPNSASTPVKTNLVFSARCNLCSTMFATVAELEEHNAVYHNTQQQLLKEMKILNKRALEERDKIIALFEESSDD